jgi:hypothetical protein
MRYLTWDHVIGRYKDAQTVADQASVANSYYIPHAEAEVDGRLASRYAVPFANTPTLTPFLVQDLAIDVAYLKMVIGKGKKEEIRKSLEERFKAILNGTLIITDALGPVQGLPNKAWFENSYHGAFGPDDVVNWAVDSQSIEAAQDARGQFNGFFGR